MATQDDELQVGTWAVRCDPVAGQVFLDLAPDGQVVLSPEAAVCMANHLAFNATFVQGIQTAMLTEGFVGGEEEAS